MHCLLKFSNSRAFFSAADSAAGFDSVVVSDSDSAAESDSGYDSVADSVDSFADSVADSVADFGSVADFCCSLHSPCFF